MTLWLSYNISVVVVVIVIVVLACFCCFCCSSYLILNPVEVVSSDIDSLLNLRDVKLIERHNITRFRVNL